MDYKHHHHYLSIDVEENKNGKIGLLIQRELEAVMNDNYRPTNKEPNYAVIQHIPYIPVSDEYVEKIKNILPEVRISKCHGYLSSYKGMIYKNSSVYKKYYLDFE